MKSFHDHINNILDGEKTNCAILLDDFNSELGTRQVEKSIAEINQIQNNNYEFFFFLQK